MKMLSLQTLAVLENINDVMIKSESHFKETSQKIWLVGAEYKKDTSKLSKHDLKQRHIGAITAINNISSDITKMLYELTK